tara:strand:+ start:503 stop:1615 length:1113 start_codon:yes stop_codon:yes gene_type:complete
MKTLDAHIFSLLEDPSMTFRELLDIVNSICLQRISLDEKIDGQNYTLGFLDNTFYLMQKGNTNFEKAKTSADLKNEIYHLSHSLNPKAGRLISIKKLMLSHLVKVNELYNQNNPSIPNQAIIECAMLSKDFVNLIEYSEQHLGLVVLDTVGMEMDKKIFSDLGLMYIEPLEYKVTNDWCNDIAEYISSLGSYTLDSTIGEYASNEVKPLLTKMGFKEKDLDSFSKRVGFKNKKLASHRTIPKDLWKKFQAAEKSWYLYRSAVQPLDIILFNMLENIFKNSKGLMEVSTCWQTMYQNLSDILDSKPTGDETEVQKFLWESEIIQPYLGFDFLNEGVVFTWKDKRYKITGAFTPINKINGFKLYKSNKIQFK